MLYFSQATFWRNMEVLVNNPSLNILPGNTLHVNNFQIKFIFFSYMKHGWHLIPFVF